MVVGGAAGSEVDFWPTGWSLIVDVVSKSSKVVQEPRDQIAAFCLDFAARDLCPVGCPVKALRFPFRGELGRGTSVRGLCERTRCVGGASA